MCGGVKEQRTCFIRCSLEGFGELKCINMHQMNIKKQTKKYMTEKLHSEKLKYLVRVPCISKIYTFKLLLLLQITLLLCTDCYCYIVSIIILVFSFPWFKEYRHDILDVPKILNACN